jgi:fucose permease
MLIFCFCAFMAFGVVLVLVGANQDAFAHALSLDLAESGLLVSLLSLGLSVGVVGAGPLFDRLPRRPLFVGALALAGFTLVSAGPGLGYSHWLVIVTLTGLGIGAYDTLINAVVAQRFRHASSRPMTIMHSAASLGAIAGPPLVVWISERSDWTSSFVYVGWAHLALAVAALFIRFPAPEKSKGTPWSRLLPVMWPLGLAAFAYVGIEACMTLFAVPYAEGLGLSEESGQYGISFFWVGLLAGRLLVAALGHGDARVVEVGGVASALLLAGAIASSTTAVGISLFCVGAALGGIYPVVIALAGQRAPGAEGSAAGLVAGLGGIGGFVVPWLTGALGDRAGIAIAYGSVAFWCILAAVGAFIAHRQRSIAGERVGA